jgi:hypothetical protein
MGGILIQIIFFIDGNALILVPILRGKLDILNSHREGSDDNSR